MSTALESAPFTTDGGQACRAAVGVVVLQTDETLEHDLRAMVPTDGVRLYVNRIANAPEVTAETLRAMQGDLVQSASMFPRAVALDVIGYGCTSASLVIGEESVAHLLKKPHPGAAVTNPYSALKAACLAIGVRRLAVVSPYSHDLSGVLMDGLENSGIDVPKICSFNEREDHRVARITPVSVLEALVSTGASDDCEAVFASCTNLRAAGVLAEAEARLGKPVLCSNQVLAWHLMRLAGLDDDSPDFGVLFKKSIACDHEYA